MDGPLPKEIKSSLNVKTFRISNSRTKPAELDFYSIIRSNPFNFAVTFIIIFINPSNSEKLPRLKS